MNFKYLLFIILFFVIFACRTPSEIWIKENPYRIYEITLLNGDKDTVKARNCRAFVQNKLGNDIPVYKIQCSNNGSDWWSIYNGMGISLKVIKDGR